MFQSICQRLERHQSTTVLTAMTTVTILALQYRQSSTARSLWKSGVHILLTATSGATLIASLLVLLTPYLHHPQRRVLQPPTHNSNRVPKDPFYHWSTTLLSLLQTNAKFIADIPTSIPTQLMKRNIQQVLSKWKGTLAVLLLTYFQYRYRTLRRRHHNNS